MSPLFKSLAPVAALLGCGIWTHPAAPSPSPMDEGLRKEIEGCVQAAPTREAAEPCITKARLRAALRS